ncbi:MAG: DitF protein [Alphaproteobacteria bacterium HGW-Alphaproteobacteria-16]|nr:MAG: DitF protein [Alphaproteobacteria bacterium HGW-Alphaproteobacteria-16]
MSGIDVVISGIGQSAVGRKLPQSGLALTVDATLEAIADAGLTVADIDGMATFPGRRPDAMPFSPVGTMDLKDALDFKLNWFAGAMEGSAQLGAIINGYAAIKAGLARHVLCFRTVKEGSGGASWKENAEVRTQRARLDGEFQYLFPYNAISASNWLSLYAQRHFHLYGTTREHLGQIAITERRGAVDNPKALFREPLTMDDYLSARMITSPFGLLDCDAPTDASTVILLSAADAVAGSGKPAIRIDSVGGGIHGRAAWDQADMPRMAAHDAAQMLWARTDLKPTDVDVALLYDGFSFLALTWLEAMGFCGMGEGGAFVEGGQRIARDGELPLNPHGGQLSSGRTHGFGFVHEAVTQLRGQAGARQVPNGPCVAAVTNGGGPMAGAMLLVRD